MTPENIPVSSGYLTERMQSSPPMCVYFDGFHGISFRAGHFITQVSSGQLDKFLNVYGTLLKTSMSTLRKRDKKREKVRAEKLAARKQRLAEPILIEGPKRGKGRRKRERRVKATLKQEAARQRIQEKQEAKEKAKV
jgi:signal recognition particle subunit SRP14